MLQPLFLYIATSKVALDVLADVTSEYLLNVGRTIRFLSDKFGQTMTPEVSGSVTYGQSGMLISVGLS